MHRRDWSQESMIEDYYAVRHVDTQGEAIFSYLFTNRTITECYKGQNARVVRVHAYEVPDGAYYGWIRTGDEKYSHVYRNKHHFFMCFGYGYEEEEKRGNGRAVKLSVEEL